MLTPMTQAEVVDTLERLASLAETTPSMATNFEFVLLSRLALTALQKPVSSEVPPSIKVVLEGPELDAFRAELLAEIEAFRAQPQQLVFQPLSIYDELSKQGLVVDLQKLVDLRIELEQKNAALNEQAGTIGLLNSRVKTLETEVSSSRDSVELMRSTLATADAKLLALSQFKESLFTYVKQREWSAGSAKYTVSKATQKPYPCCPVCQGLNPDGLKHDDAGHRPRCVLAAILSEVYKMP